MLIYELSMEEKRKTRGKQRERQALSLRSSIELLDEVRQIIHEARKQTARAVNAGVTLLYWQVGSQEKGLLTWIP